MATGLQIKVGADTTEFKQEIRQLPKEFQKAEEEITQSAERVGGALDGALKGLISAGTVVAIERLISHFDKVADAASKYGESAEDIQRVGVAADMTGSNIDSVAMAMERAGVAAAKAARGNEEFVEKFDRAGIDAAAFSTASLTERIEMVSRAQDEAGNSGDRHSAILEALGDSAASIDFQRIAEEMGDVVVASDAAVESLSRASDTMAKGKNAAMVFGAEGLNVLGDYFQRIGSILGDADNSSGVLGKLAAFIRLSMQTTPAAGMADMLGLGGKTERAIEGETRRMKAIAELRSREGNNNATEEQIKREIEAIKERERLANRPTPPPSPDDDSDKKNSKTEQNAAIKQRLLEISLQLKEAEAANNRELVAHLEYQEDLYKGILKYKDAEDAYGMAVRAANAELAKRGKITDDGQRHYQGSLANFNFENMTPHQKRYMEALASGQTTSQASQYGGASDDLRFKGAYEQMYRQAAMPEAERNRAGGVTSPIDAKEQEQDKATETTLQKAVAFLEELTSKLPQPALV